MNPKRILVIVLAVTLMLAAAPTAQANNPTTTETWNFMDQNRDSSGQGWVWESATNTLTLTDFTQNTSADTALLLPGDSTLVLEGENHITLTSDGSGFFGAWGVLSIGSLTIDGTGSLTVTLDGTRQNIGMSAMYLTFNNAAVSIITGDVDGANMGISTYNGITVNSGSLTVASGGNSGLSSFSSAGIASRSSFSSFTLNGGEVNVASGNSVGNSWGINVVGGFIMNGGTLNVTSGPATRHSVAIIAANITINGGHGTARASEAGINSHAIEASPRFSQPHFLQLSEELTIVGWDGIEYTIPGNATPYFLADESGAPLARLQFGDNINFNPLMGR